MQLQVVSGCGIDKLMCYKREKVNNKSVQLVIDMVASCQPNKRKQM
jgi:hypothetical protein